MRSKPEKSTKTHNAYWLPGVIDLAKLREEAERRQSYQRTVIHFHPYREDCEGMKHEYY